MFKHFITFIASQKIKNLTRFTFFLADTKRLRDNCRPLRTKLVYQFFRTVADCQIIFHNITGNRTGLNINPVTFCLSNRSCASAVQFTNDFRIRIWFLTNIYIICRNGNTNIGIFRFRFWCRRRCRFFRRLRCCIRDSRTTYCACPIIGVTRHILKRYNCFRI